MPASVRIAFQPNLIGRLSQELFEESCAVTGAQDKAERMREIEQLLESMRKGKKKR
jgi:hypothetical protein